MSSNIRIVDTTTGNVLGMVWNPKEDTFSFNTDPLPQPNDKEDVTSREALSVTSRVFDPAGLLAPLTLGGKIIMRNLSKDAKNDAISQKNFWNMTLPNMIKVEYFSYITELSLTNLISFDRCLKPANACGSPILVVFSDGSKEAYGACAFVRWELTDGSFDSNLICAKTDLLQCEQ